jgi:diguanylate cyclase (GGDEF)-like protein
LNSKTEGNRKRKILVFDHDQRLSSCPFQLCHSYSELRTLYQDFDLVLWVEAFDLLPDFFEKKEKETKWSFVTYSSYTFEKTQGLKERFSFESILEAPLAFYEWSERPSDPFVLSRSEMSLLKEVEFGMALLKQEYSSVTLEAFFSVFNVFKNTFSLRRVQGFDSLCAEVSTILRNTYKTNIPSGTQGWFLHFLKFFYRQLKRIFQGYEVPSVSLDPGILCLSDTCDFLFQHSHQSLYLCENTSQLDDLFKKNIFPSFIYMAWKKENQELLSYIKQERYHYYRHVPLLIGSTKAVKVSEKSPSTYLVTDSIVSERYSLAYYDEIFSVKKAEKEQVFFLNTHEEIEYNITRFCQKLFIDLHIIKAPFYQLDTYKKIKPDCILLDIDLKEEKDLELIKVLRSDIRFRNTPILLMTHTKSKESLVEKAYQEGVTEILCKPVQERSFQYRLCKLLQKEQELKMAKHEDARLGLLTREGFKSAFHHFCEKEGVYGVFAVLDLDNLKKVNDTFGHGEGDRLLFNFSQFIKEKLEDTTLIVRWGGDEFLLFFMNHSPELVVEKLEQVLKEYREVEEFPFPLGFSCGIAAFPEEGTRMDSLFIRADKYLYQAKQEGKGLIRGKIRDTSSSC